jgi:hypothetical protein
MSSWRLRAAVTGGLGNRREAGMAVGEESGSGGKRIEGMTNETVNLVHSYQVCQPAPVASSSKGLRSRLKQQPEHLTFRKDAPVTLNITTFDFPGHVLYLAHGIRLHSPQCRLLRNTVSLISSSPPPYLHALQLRMATAP